MYLPVSNLCIQSTPLKFSADSSGLPAKKGQTGKLEKHDSKHDSWCYDSMLSGSGYD